MFMTIIITICLLSSSSLSLVLLDSYANNINNNTELNSPIENTIVKYQENPAEIPCTCGIFLSSQFKIGAKEQPKGEPVLTQEIDVPFMNNAFGNKQCTHKCIEMIIKHLPKSNEIICAAVDNDSIYREKAYLFVKNRSIKWHSTKFSAGREYCCKNHEPLKC